MFDRLQRRNNSHTVKTNHAKVVLLICPDNPTGAIALSFGQRDDNADTRAKFCFNQFIGFQSSNPKFRHSPVLVCSSLRQYFIDLFID